ncbi:MAG: RHS repeat-associated protein, partial [Colwellia sp.]
TLHYQPFGETIGTQSDDVGYTGHKFDTDIGLSYMQARYYDPVIGRFYSNDPVGWNPRNPVHSFGRYTYANNNPYKYTDPTGMEGEETYKKEIEKPEYKKVEVTFDIVLTIENSDGSTSSTSTDGTTSDNASIDVGPISFGASKDKATGAVTRSTTVGPKIGLKKLNISPTVTVDSNGDLTGAVQLTVDKATVAVQGKTPIAKLMHNIKTVVSQANDSLTTSPSGN